MPEPRASIVVLTRNRAAELCCSLRHLMLLPGSLPVIVVDNASTDGTPEIVRRCFPQVDLVTCDVNRGAAGRNAGVARVRTPVVAFCDDDTWWQPGSVERAADVLEQYPQVAAVAARILVGERQRIDANCRRMALSPLPSEDLPGPRLAAFMAGAVVMRTDAFRAVGGYEPRLFLGAEESLMALDLMARDWSIVYCPDVVTCHRPSRSRNSLQRRSQVLRNRLWIGWMRLPPGDAARETAAVLRDAWRQDVLLRTAASVLAGLPWAFSRRRVVPPATLAAWRLVFGRRPTTRPARPLAERPPREIGP